MLLSDDVERGKREMNEHWNVHKTSAQVSINIRYLSFLCERVFVSDQTLGENAPSQLILYHYDDLKERKGLVLMTAELDPKFIVSCQPSSSTTVFQLLSNDLNPPPLPPTDRPPGSVFGQSGAAVLRDAEAGDVPIGGDVQPPAGRFQTHVCHSRAGTERTGHAGAPSGPPHSAPMNKWTFFSLFVHKYNVEEYICFYSNICWQQRQNINQM